MLLHLNSWTFCFPLTSSHWLGIEKSCLMSWLKELTCLLHLPGLDSWFSTLPWQILSVARQPASGSILVLGMTIASLCHCPPQQPSKMLGPGRWGGGVSPSVSLGLLGKVSLVICLNEIGPGYVPGKTWAAETKATAFPQETGFWAAQRSAATYLHSMELA